jgi:DNA-binding transcriptional LysR family regulator
MSALDLNDFAVFVRVVDHAGFAKAARELHVPTSTVSRAIARLEAGLGTNLVQRTTRSVTPTAEGRAFYHQVAPAVSALNDAARGIDGADLIPQGQLRITAPNDFGEIFLADVLVRFAKAYPKVSVDVELTARQVNLVQEGFDVALRAMGKLPDSTLIARKMGQVDGGLFASPTYLEGMGAVRSIEDLGKHDCLLFRGRNGESEWRLVGPEGERLFTVRGKISGDDYVFLRTAAVAGGGIADLPSFTTSNDIDAGLLVPVLRQHRTKPGAQMYVVYAGGRKVPAKVAVFRDFVIEAFSSQCRERGRFEAMAKVTSARPVRSPRPAKAARAPSR